MKVFVFGSNTAGRHGKGAALEAKNKWGAEYGQGEGFQGRSYGIPTKKEVFNETNLRMELVPCSLKSIGRSVAKFIMFAKMHPQRDFLLTAIGCGLAGFKTKDMAKLFEDAVELENVYFPEMFCEVLGLNRAYMSFDKYDRMVYNEKDKQKRESMG